MAKDTTKSVADDNDPNVSTDDQFNKTEEELTDGDILAASGPLALLLVHKGVIGRKELVDAVKKN